jgi:hypothetical protein
MVRSATAVCAMHWYQGAASTTATSTTATTSASRLITATSGGVLAQYNAVGDCDGTYDVGTGIRAMASDGHIVVTACIDDTLRYYIIVIQTACSTCAHLTLAHKHNLRFARFYTKQGICCHCQW